MTKLKEEHEDLNSKLRCARDTIKVLNEQVTQRDQELSAVRMEWGKREESLMKEREKLTLENANLKKICDSQLRKLKEMNENLDNLKRMYDFEESKSRKNSKTIAELQLKLNFVENENPKSRTISRARMYTTTEGPEPMNSARVEPGIFSFDSKPITIKKNEGADKNGSTRMTLGAPKVPQVKPMAKGVLHNPLRNFFA